MLALGSELEFRVTPYPETLQMVAGRCNPLAAIGDNIIHSAIGAVLVEVEQTELLDAGFTGQTKDVGVHRVAPLDEGCILRRGVFGVVEQEVGLL